MTIEDLAEELDVSARTVQKHMSAVPIALLNDSSPTEAEEGADTTAPTGGKPNLPTTAHAALIAAAAVTERRRRGAKPDFARAAVIAGVIALQAPDEKWRSFLGDILR